MSRLRAEHGQTTAEYMGLLVLVGVIIAAVNATGLPEKLASAVALEVSCMMSDVPCEEVRQQGDDNADRRGEASSDDDRMTADRQESDERRAAARARQRELAAAQTRFADLTEPPPTLMPAVTQDPDEADLNGNGTPDAQEPPAPSCTPRRARDAPTIPVPDAPSLPGRPPCAADLV